jgi:hypothetical protein
VIDLNDICAAARAIEGKVVRTPFLKSITLSEFTGVNEMLHNIALNAVSTRVPLVSSSDVL